MLILLLEIWLFIGFIAIVFDIAKQYKETKKVDFYVSSLFMSLIGITGGVFSLFLVIFNHYNLHNKLLFSLKKNK